MSVASLFEGQLFGLGELLMGFKKMCFERDPYFLDQRKAIPGLDRLSEFPSIVHNVICIGYLLRVGIGTICYVPVLKKVLIYFENVFNWRDGVIMNLCHFFFQNFQTTRGYFPYIARRYAKI